MTYNTILVQLDLDKPATEILNFGLGLAREFEAQAIGFAAAEIQVLPSGHGAILAAEAMKRQQEEMEERLDAMKQEFLGIAGEHASWRGLVGNPTQLLALHARAADLIVVATPETASGGDAHRAVDPGSLVLSAGRPVFVAAPSFSPIHAGKVMVAWKDTREARRAVSDAMPFLEKAKEVMVITIEEGDQRHARDSAADVVRFLMRHGVKARSDVLGVGSAAVEVAMARIASDMDADLVVAGAYGHSRLREWAFGGVTRSLLTDGSRHRLISS